jgi:hypothetical protein
VTRPPDRERKAADEAAAELEVRAAEQEAARIGGTAGDEASDPARRPLQEAGGGESEGFEAAEELLIEHASHGDQQSTHVILHDRGAPEDPAAAEQEQAEADHERTSERERGTTGD